jgi:hypothetical protein
MRTFPLFVRLFVYGKPINDFRLLIYWYNKNKVTFYLIWIHETCLLRLITVTH